jgi:peptide deformylase
MIRKIIDVKNPKLRIISKTIGKIDKRITGIATDLKDTLANQKDPEGVGLSAVQIGINVRMFAMVYKNNIKIVINPEILSLTKKKENKKRNDSIMEGCLSILNYYGPLKRPQGLTLKYQDLEGKTKTERFEGLAAQIVQHEVDHLNGILFTDKLVKQKSSLYKLDKGEWEEVEL